MKVRDFALAVFSASLLISCSHASSTNVQVSDQGSVGELCNGNYFIVDSNTTWADERSKALARGFPSKIVDQQRLIDVCYFSFDGRIHKGQIVMDHRLESDVKQIFGIFLKNRFPVGSVIPISRFNWDDTESMLRNNTSGFNYRKIKGKNEWSNHAYGQAMDINTVQNPYVSGRHVSPKGAKYNKKKPGTFAKGSRLVQDIKALGWAWGGEWRNMKDYQHFEKVL
jgi:peptidoglycan L-alanyl-D-glutamate endopeptidase CwlK